MEGHYEAPYLKKDVAAVEPGEWAGPPLTFKLPQNGGYASITEANLVNYSGMGLESNGRGGWVIGLGHRQPLNYPFELRYGREEGKRLGKAAAIAGEITTPWRVVMIGRDLNSLVTSTILPNLCPPPDPALFPDGIKTSWVKPGRAVWRYVDGGPQGVEGMKEFSRLAGQLGFEYHVIEGVWRKWTMDERRDVVSYSRQQGVGVWFWRHTNQLRTPEARDEFFKMLRDLGVAGAKLDFFDHEAKEIVDLYEALLRKAAEHQILLVFHGSNKPTGRERTWPNELVRESVRGMESSAMLERARHQTILPFTRYLAGPADYTTMLFTERRARLERGAPDCEPGRVRQPVADHRGQSREHPGQPGGRRHQEHSVDVGRDARADRLRDRRARRCSRAERAARGSWRRCAVTAAKTIQVPLSFLGAGQYQSTLVRDAAADGSTVVVEPGSYSQKETITLELRAGGGFVGRFSSVSGR